MIDEYTVSAPYPETLTISAKYGGQLYIICNTYRPPRGNMQLFVDALSGILSRINDKFPSAKSIVLGDFNVNLLRLNRGYLPLKYVTNMYALGYIPRLLRPTRVTTSSAMLIDMVKKLFCSDKMCYS